MCFVCFCQRMYTNVNSFFRLKVRNNSTQYIISAVRSVKIEEVCVYFSCCVYITAQTYKILLPHSLMMLARYLHTLFHLYSTCSKNALSGNITICCESRIMFMFKECMPCIHDGSKSGSLQYNPMFFHCSAAMTVKWLKICVGEKRSQIKRYSQNGLMNLMKQNDDLTF
jgi:hypothetical protein